MRSLATLLLAIAVSCSDPIAKRSLTVRDSAGVKIVTNLGPAPDTVALDSAVLRIGGVDVTEEYSFLRLSDVAVLADGSVIVSDLPGRVAQFDSTGQWIRDFGRSGSGPGEFRQPVFVEVVGDTLAVWDARLARLSLFNIHGEFLDLARIRKRGRLPMYWRGAVWFDEREWGQDLEARAMVVRVARNETLDTVKGPYPIPGSRTGMQDGRIVVQLPPVFSKRPQWQVCEDGLLWSASHAPRVEQLGFAGDLQRVIELARLPREIVDADREAYAGAIAARWDLSEVQAAAIVRDGDFAAQAPFIGALVCGEDGAVWASHFDPAVPEFNNPVSSMWDEIAKSGRVVAHVTFPVGFVLKVVAHGKAYGIARRELDVNVVEIYSLPAR